MRAPVVMVGQCEMQAVVDFGSLLAAAVVSPAIVEQLSWLAAVAAGTGGQ